MKVDIKQIEIRNEENKKNKFFDWMLKLFRSFPKSDDHNDTNNKDSNTNTNINNNNTNNNNNNNDTNNINNNNNKSLRKTIKRFFKRKSSTLKRQQTTDSNVNDFDAQQTSSK